MRKDRLTLEISEDQRDDGDESEDGEECDEVVAYLTLPDHPGDGVVAVKKNLRLRDLVGDYKGPDLYFDFDENNVLVGVEIID